MLMIVTILSFKCFCGVRSFRLTLKTVLKYACVVVFAAKHTSTCKTRTACNNQQVKLDFQQLESGPRAIGCSLYSRALVQSSPTDPMQAICESDFNN